MLYIIKGRTKCMENNVVWAWVMTCLTQLKALQKIKQLKSTAHHVLHASWLKERRTPSNKRETFRLEREEASPPEPIVPFSMNSNWESDRSATINISLLEGSFPVKLKPVGCLFFEKTSGIEWDEWDRRPHKRCCRFLSDSKQKLSKASSISGPISSSKSYLWTQKAGELFRLWQHSFNDLVRVADCESRKLSPHSQPTADSSESEPCCIVGLKSTFAAAHRSCDCLTITTPGSDHLSGCGLQQTPI